MSNLRFVMILLLLFFPVFIFAEEVTITTYYPAPYGVYRELRATRIAIGDNYIQSGTYDWEITDGDGGEVDSLADLVVEGNVGIGTASPGTKLELKGGHGDTLLKLYSIGDGASGDATLNLWASEPGWTYTGAGIGNNINKSAYYGRLNTARGASYIRLLDNAIYFDTINSAGADVVNLFLSAGNVGIGTTSPTYQLQLSTDSAAKPSTNTWTVASDMRIKKDIRPYTNGLEIIKKIKPVWFKYNGKGGFAQDNQDHVGVVAQEIVKAAPYTINTFRAKLNPEDKEETELLNFNSHALTFDLINAVKELDGKVTDLARENQELREANKWLKSAIETLKSQVTCLEANMASGLF
ncbi:MAG: tail fiber domain-containing protein [Candidatus Omnitrophica bacterium]|nr:tail fiber domain-containing protein [Candidatus Omnitrophota bacterium]